MKGNRVVDLKIVCLLSVGFGIILCTMSVLLHYDQSKRLGELRADISKMLYPGEEASDQVSGISNSLIVVYKKVIRRV